MGDGICDCCDGSDEWTGRVSCPNTCSEMGRAAREAAEARTKVIQEGLNKRQVMVEEARTQLQEKKLRLQEKEARKSELEMIKEEKERLKEEAEAPEKEALDYYRKIEEEEKKRAEEAETARAAAEAESYFVELDTNQDGVVTIAELQTRSGLDTNKDGQVTEDEAKFFLGDKESLDLQTFTEGAFALMKPYLDLERTQTEDPVEETQTEAGEEYHAPDHPMMTPSPEDVDHPDHPMNTPAPPTDLDEDYHEDEDRDEEDEDYDINEHHDEPEVKREEAAKPESKYDEATQRLIEAAEAARKAFNDADRDLRDVEREIKQLSESLDKNYGEDSVFAVLQGQCFEYTDNEYTYKMCPFDYSSQRGKHGGAETRLGSWGEWTGPEEDKHSRMKFSGGQTCWNGPARSTEIFLHCGAENVLSAVSEPNRCEYEMHFTTPAVCSAGSSTEGGHDEL